MKTFLVGSRYFFKNIKGFKSKDTDRLILIDNPVEFKLCRQITGKGICIFEWKRLTPQEYINHAISCELSMIVGKFLIPEFCKEIGFTIEHLKKLESVFNRLDEKHLYEKVIYDSYIENNDFILTEEQRLNAYNVYLEKRKK